MAKVVDWIQRVKHNMFVLRDQCDPSKNLALGDASDDDDRNRDSRMFSLASTNDPGHWRYISIESLVVVLVELYGKDYLKRIIDIARPYDEIQDRDLKTRSKTSH